MVAAPASILEEVASGRIRPINLRRDLQQVSALMRLAFGAAMTADRYTAFDGRIIGDDGYLFGLFPLHQSRLVPGFVWDEDGRIVGNVSILPSAVPGRYLVANVAVHPEYRRRGIARGLMQATMQEVHRQNGRVVMLQVEHQNRPAIDLYQSLGFDRLGEISSWRAGYTQLRDLAVPGSQRSPDVVGNYLLRPLRGPEWRKAFELDGNSVAPDLDWPQPLSYQAYKQGFLVWLRRFMSGQQVETWVIADEAQQQLLALARITSEWGRAHQLRLRVRPAGKGKFERPLLAKLIRRIKYLANRPVRIDHPAGDEVVNQILVEANFTVQRTLAVMRKEM